MSLDRRLSVLPSVMISVGARDARVAETGYFGLHQGLTADFVGIAVGVDDVLIDAPGDFEGNVLLDGKRLSSWCCWRDVSRQDLVCSILRALYRGSVARPRRWWSSC